ncbi:uncharacterized [Tachysurus ichikawai]
MELSRLAGSGPSCPIRYCLISSAKQPLPSQPCCHLLPPTRWLLPSTSHTALLPASARARPRPKARTWLLTAGGSLLSFFPTTFDEGHRLRSFVARRMVHAPPTDLVLQQFGGAADFTHSGSLPLAWICICSLFYSFSHSRLFGGLCSALPHTQTHSCEVEGRQRGV